MDSILAFSKGKENQGNELKVFDWDKAAKIIAEKKPTLATAGLQSDWEWTGGSIYENGKPVSKDETYTYLASNWATPELDLDGHVMDCFKMEGDTDGWDAHTYWPESALKVLNS